jgi:hypothetical protein
MAIGSWYPDAVLYRLCVEAFCDADHDGVGDFQGLTQKLGYLQSLGVTCVDLLPLDRTACGDFFQFLVAARNRGLRVLVDIDGGDSRDPGVCRSSGGDARFWLDFGADGVVLQAATGDTSRQALSDVPRTPSEHDGGAARFVAVNGVPTPCSCDAAGMAELGTFRAQLVPTLIEAIRRDNNVPLLGLMARLAVRIAGVGFGCNVDDSPDVGEPSPAATDVTMPTRLAPLVEGHAARLDLLHRLLFSLPGPPLLVFGDEIGMDDVVRDRASIWSPMRWSANGDGGVANVESQERSYDSPLNRMRKLARVRRQSCALTCGNASPVALGAGPGVGFVREFGRDVVLVVANLGASPHEVECDLTGYQGRQVVDMVRRRPLAPVSDVRYSVVLGPYGCYWLRLVAR